MDPARVHDALAKLEAGEFYAEEHQIIFDAMAAMADENRTIDYISLKNELERRGKLKQIRNGAVYIVGLTDGIPAGMNVDAYADIVKDKAAMRRLIKVSSETVQKGISGTHESDELLEEVMGELYDLAETRTRGDLVPIGAVVETSYKNLEKRGENRAEVTGIPTGFGLFDKITRGLKPGEYCLIAARPGCGKTTFSLNVAAHAGIREKKKVAVFSLEMGLIQLSDKIMCAEAGVDFHRFGTGNILKNEHKNEWEDLAKAAAAISEAPIWLCERAELTMTQLRAMCHQMKARNGLGLVIVDYIQLLSAGQRIESRYQEVSLISRKMKVLAQELQIPVLVPCQLNRAIEHGKGREPELSDLRETGSLEQDADMVMFLHKQEEEGISEEQERLGGPVKLLLKKNRNGATGAVDLVFAKSITKFYGQAMGCQF